MSRFKSLVFNLGCNRFVFLYCRVFVATLPEAPDSRKDADALCSKKN